MLRFQVLYLFLTLAAVGAPAQPSTRIVVFNDDGGWCWFEDERAIIHQGQLLIGSVATGSHDVRRRGNIEVLAYDLSSGISERVVLHAQLQSDDHDSPALLALPDGRVLAMYSRHGSDSRILYRFATRAGDSNRWSEERTFVPSASSRVTYSNLHYLSAEAEGKGRIYNFFRGLDDTFKPSFLTSDDGGHSWKIGHVLIDVPGGFRHRPYVQYAGNGHDAIHFLYTEGHPRNYDNSVYHVYYRDGHLHHSDGTVIGSLSRGLVQPEEGTRVFRGNADNVAWVSDLCLDALGRPYAAYSVQKDSAGLPPGQGGQDHRYRYAYWDGSQWQDQEIAYAGSRLYAGEDDYTGNIALDPGDPSTVYISTDVDPVTGEKLPGGHYEIFRGHRQRSAAWSWTPITGASTVDNIRPIVPKSDGRHRVLLWLRGTYSSYTEYDLDVVGTIGEGRGAK